MTGTNLLQTARQTSNIRITIPFRQPILITSRKKEFVSEKRLLPFLCPLFSLNRRLIKTLCSFCAACLASVRASEPI